MINLEVNGEALVFNVKGCHSFDDVIALIREAKSPEEVVSSAWWNGSPLSNEELDLDPHSEEGTLEVHTRRRKEYVTERLSVASRYVTQISDSFSQSVHAFRTGHSGFGNTFLARGIDELLSFVSWYSTILNLESNGINIEPKSRDQAPGSEFFGIVQSLQQACERLVSAQLLESSFTIATELESQLLPELLKLKNCCQSYASDNSLPAAS